MAGLAGRCSPPADRADAEAIVEAPSRPILRVVAMKSVEIKAARWRSGRTNA
jgi:hypothetical protein